MARTVMGPKGNDDEGVRSAFTSDKGWPGEIPVRAEVGVGQVRTIEHNVRREVSDRALIVEGHNVLCREHVINAWPGRRLEDAFSERVGYVAPDLFGALSLSAQLGHLQVPRKERARALRIHALWLLSSRLRVLHDGREARSGRRGS